MDRCTNLLNDDTCSSPKSKLEDEKEICHRPSNIIQSDDGKNNK